MCWLDDTFCMFKISLFTNFPIVSLKRITLADSRKLSSSSVFLWFRKQNLFSGSNVYSTLKQYYLIVLRLSVYSELTGVNILHIYSLQYGDLPKARVIVAVSLAGSARKLITVRSALLLTNLLHCPVDIRLENTAVRLGGMTC